MRILTPEINTVLHYHEETKHRPNRYARSLGYMDWANQPNPFRSYNGVPTVRLRDSYDNASASYADVMAHDVQQAPLCPESLAQFVQFGMGIMAYKSYGADSWALRANASSGNLQPTELYLLLEEDSGFEKGIYHYAIDKHALSKISSAFTSDLKEGSFIVALTSIYWREIWKYGERAFRYTQLDLGHAYGALLASAKTLGWKIHVLNAFDQEHMQRLLGLDEHEVFDKEEREYANIFIRVDTQELCYDPILIESVLAARKADQLSPMHASWPIIDEVIKASLTKSSSPHIFMPVPFLSSAHFPMLEVIKKRRSAQMFEPNFTLPLTVFSAIINEVSHLIEGFEAQSHVVLALTLNRVESLDSGVYLLARKGDTLDRFKSQTTKTFEYEPFKLGNVTLFRVIKEDLSAYAQSINCQQAIASDATFSVAMLTYFEETVTKEAWTYKKVFNICGMIGQQFYLSATSQEVQATGIGCFLDEAMPTLLGIESSGFRDLYHLSVGKGLVDPRLTTTTPQF